MILDEAGVFHRKRRLTQSEGERKPWRRNDHRWRALFVGPFRLGIALVKAMALAYGRAGKSSQTRCMLNPACKGTGSLSAVDRLAAALTPNDYEQLTSFAARRLRSARAGCRQGDRLGVVEPADLVHQAILKALLGQAGFPGGWHLRATDLVNPQTFRRALQSIINSTVIGLAKRAEYRTDHVPVGDPANEPGAVEPETRLDTHRLLELRDV
jgi:hypothetical protein